jgi:hypothetical protein
MTMPQPLAALVAESDQAAIAALLSAQAQLDGSAQDRARGLLASLLIERCQAPIGAVIELDYVEHNGDFVPSVTIDGVECPVTAQKLRATMMALQQAWRPFAYGEIVVTKAGCSRARLA